MIYDSILKGNNVVLRTIELSDCNEIYLQWLNDPEVNQYLETRWQEQSLESIKEFVSNIRNSNHSLLMAIIYNNRHVGNIKIGPIHPIYKHADISYFIGDKTVWGKGIATESISLISRFAFEKLGLNKLHAGAYEKNIGSQKALLKSGYQLEGVFRKKVFMASHNDYCDIYEYGMLAAEQK